MESVVGRENTSAKRVLFIFYFFIFFAMGALFPLLAVYLKNDVGLTDSQIGTVMSISPIVMIFAQPLWGMVSDYTQKPVMLLIGAIIGSALIAIVYANIIGYFALIVITGLLALTQSAQAPISDSIALSYSQRTKTNYGSIRLWGSIGFASAVYIVGRLSEHFGVQMIFYMFIVTMFISAIIAWKMPRESQKTAVNLRVGIKKLVKMRQLMLFIFSTFLLMGPVMANNVYFGIYITNMGGTLAGVGLGFLLAAGSEVPFMYVVNKVIRRFGLMNTLLVAALVSMLRWYFYFCEPSLMWIYATTITQGISVGLYIPAALQYVRELAPTDVRTTAVSMYTAIGNSLGSCFFTFIGGYVSDIYGVAHVYLFFSILTGLGIVLLLFVRSAHKVEQVIN